MPHGRRILLLAGLALAPALAACGSENTRLIDERRAQRLTASVEQVGRATTRGDCDAAQRAVTDAQTQVQALPRRVDARLRSNLTDWLGHLEERIPQDCTPADATPTPTATPAVTETPQPTPTPVPEETATPAPEETPTPTPEATAPPADAPEEEAEPEEGGGVPGGEDDGGGAATP